MGGIQDERLKAKDKEMLVVQFDDQRKPAAPLRLLAMEWVVDNICKNYKGLQDLPRDLREELESRQSWRDQQRRFDCECNIHHSVTCGFAGFDFFP